MAFVDEVRVVVQAGDGGRGCESFYRDKHMRYPRPNGGDGGIGGDIIIMAQRGVQTLLDFKFQQHFKAHKGGNASSNNKWGKNGEDVILRVPVGTIIRDFETKLLIKDLTEDQQSVVVAKGGAGGIGNMGKKTPRPPQEGQRRVIHLELKLIADVGIIGFPNAGKSTLISQISGVKSKVANYPFTTKQPILGFVEHDEKEFIIADLPGIIEGAHLGKGLGIKFLKHAERTKILIHLIDMAGTDTRDPLEDYDKINEELDAYSDLLIEKKKIVVANKMDVEEAKNNLKRFKKKYKMVKIIPISAQEKEGLEKLLDVIKDSL